MKNKLLSIGMISMTGILLSSFALMQKDEDPQEPKKSRHIKMIKTENGKTVELDTVLTNDDVFVWEGDTISPLKHIKQFNDNIRHVDVNVDHRNGNEKVMIVKHRNGKGGKPMILNIDSDKDMGIITEDTDSLGKKVIVRKMIKGGDANHMMYFRHGDMNGFPPPPPPPPVPPVPHMKMMRMQHAGQDINLSDPNIVSFKKKDIKGGLEKIEIVRKKPEGNEDMMYNLDFNDQLAPEAPDFNWESDGDSLRIKIIEKKKVIKGKDGKEIEVKVETEDNK